MRSIPGYEITEELFESPNTLVYRARDGSNGRSVIIKLLRETHPSTEDVAWFQREYEITRSLNPGISSSEPVPGAVELYELESSRERVMMVLEDFGGQSLDRSIRSDPFSLNDFLAIALQVVDTLGQVHDRRVIHKDLNPSNIVLNPQTGQVKIIDFGQATVLSQENPNPVDGNVLEGTLAYISPEQTGRMNRAVDYRSDFYSLGVTFYEMLTGRLPFDSEDPLALVHAHLALLPASPAEVNSMIPEVVGEIVLKMMSKNAEDRYQSAFGLKVDLENCIQQMKETGQIKPFALGLKDASGRFHIPQKLYGRSKEIRSLLDAFGRTSQGTSGLVLVAGRAGIGKSALVHEVYKPITRQRGFFISGKFDQLQRNIPYASLNQAFASLVRQLLTQSEHQLKDFRRRLQAAVGPNGQVIIDFIPEMEAVLGSQPEIPDLPASEAQQRFKLVARSFVGELARREHPLVIFLDDLQWADSASLRLLETLLLDSSIKHLLLIGAYRDNEVNPAHPLMHTLSHLQEAGIAMDSIDLRPLQIADVTEYVVDALNRAPADAAPLAELILSKTDGNPFFMNEFLKTLHSDGLLRFDFPSRAWTWDLSEIRARSITDNVVELMSGKLQELSDDTQKVLMMAAAIGNRFGLRTLSTVSERTEVQTAKALEPAVEAGLVFPLSKAYELISHGLQDAQHVDFEFSHDRIQQAAYSLIPEEGRSTVHRHVGLLLLHSIPSSQQEQAIFDIANHLNLALDLLESDAERVQLAQLNLQAGRKAKASAAYEPALPYLERGLEVLGGGDWEYQYDLTLSLYDEAAEAAYLAPNFDRMAELIEAVLVKARTPMEMSKAYEIRIQSGFARNRPLEAVKDAQQILKLLGIKIPERPKLLDIGLGLIGAMLALFRKSPEDLLELPLMEDANSQAGLRILTRVAPGVYIAVPELVPLSMVKMVQLSVKKGNAPASAFAYVGYGLIQCGVLGNIDAGYRFGRVGLDLVDRLGAKKYEAAARTYYGAFIMHWKHSLHDTLEPLAETYQIGLETGDVGSASIAALIYAYHAYFAGRELGALEREISSFSQAMEQLNQTTTLISNRFFHQIVLNLRGESPDPCQIIGTSYDREVMLPIHLEANDRSIIWNLYWNQLVLCYLFHDFEGAVENADFAADYADAAIASYSSGAYPFYDSLARLAIYSEASRSQRRRIIRRVRTNQKKLRKWARLAPMNYLNKLHLVDAERARVLGNSIEAEEQYEKAIDLANTHGFVQEEALAYELAAHFYLERGRHQVAQVYASNSYQAYRRWGALAKVRDLETRYGQLLALSPIEKSRTLTSPTTITPGAQVSSEMDLASVLRASQAISDEIVLQSLLANLLSIVIENAGAERGYLILETADEWFIEAAGQTSETEVRSIPISEANVPVSVINYVVRSMESVVLDDATRSTSFGQDPYVQRETPKSVLCMPLINQGRLIGLLYLENNVTVGAFTPHRLEILNLLSSQAAISIENATLFNSLEQKVEERTRQLANAKRAAEQSRALAEEANESKSDFLANVSHELRTPLTSVIGFAKIIRKRFADRILPNIDNSERNTQRAIDQVQSNIDIVIAEGERLTALINNLLDLAKIEAGKLEWHMQPLEIPDLIEHATAATASLFEQKNLELHKDLRQDLPLVEGDRDRLIQVVINLISNAVKFTDQGSITCSAYGKNGEVVVSVADTGAGISSEDLETAFEKFAQVGDTLTDKPKGTGLGLPISKQIIEYHGGRIWVESELGMGSTFSFALPSVNAEEPQGGNQK